MPMVNASHSTIETGDIQHLGSPPSLDDLGEYAGHNISTTSTTFLDSLYIHDAIENQMKLDGIHGSMSLTHSQYGDGKSEPRQIDRRIRPAFTNPQYSSNNSLRRNSFASSPESPLGTKAYQAAKSPQQPIPPGALSSIAGSDLYNDKSGRGSMDISSLLNPAQDTLPTGSPGAFRDKFDERNHKPLTILTWEKTLTSQTRQQLIPRCGSTSPIQAESEKRCAEILLPCRDYLPSVSSDIELPAHPKTNTAMLRITCWREDIHDTFHDRGITLFDDLKVLLLQARLMISSADHLDDTQGTNGKQRHPYHDWVANLHCWRQDIGYFAKTIVGIVVRTMGPVHSRNAYVSTKTFSIYLWWRICKMSLEIDFMTAHVRKSIAYVDEFECIEELLNALWNGLMSAIENDIEDILSASEKGVLVMETHLGQGSVSMSDLLMHGDLFATIPNLDDLPEPESNYRILDHLQSTSNESTANADRVRKEFCDDEANSQHHDLKLLFTEFPILLIDYEHLLYKSKSTSLSAETGNLPLESYSVKHITRNRPFRNYLDRVVIQIRPDKSYDAGKEVFCVYQNLLRGIGSVSKLYVKLRRALATAPDLFAEFERFVPQRSLAKWNKVEEAIRTRTQVNMFKQQVGINFNKPLEEQSMSKRESQSPVIPTKSACLEKLQAEMELLANAILVPQSYNLTKQAVGQIDALKIRVQMASVVFARLIPTSGCEQNDDPRDGQRERWEEILKDLKVKNFKVGKNLAPHGEHEEFCRSSAPTPEPQLRVTVDTTSGAITRT